jgi:hypothetical protein
MLFSRQVEEEVLDEQHHDEEERLLALRAHYLAAIEVVLDQLHALGVAPEE